MCSTFEKVFFRYVRHPAGVYPSGPMPQFTTAAGMPQAGGHPNPYSRPAYQRAQMPQYQPQHLAGYNVPPTK